MMSSVTREVPSVLANQRVVRSAETRIDESITAGCALNNAVICLTSRSQRARSNGSFSGGWKLYAG